MAEQQEILEDIKCTITDTLDDEWIKACESYEFETDSDYAAYGNTFVSTGSYITEDSEEDFRKSFMQENNPDELVKKLMLDPFFRESLKNLVKEYANNKEIGG